MSPPQPDAEFYVGYLPSAPPHLGRRLSVIVALLLATGAGLAFLVASGHGLRPAARFEYGTPVELSGTLVARPYPQLLVPRPGRTESLAPYSSYALVGPWKHGADSFVSGLEGRPVQLAATLAHRDGAVVAEVVPESLRESGAAPLAPAPPVPLGTRSLMGEIVDSKCFFGVMNPGELKPHRGCAARCISGGIPPVLCVRDAAGRASYFLLVDERGGPVNAAVLDLVAEPVEITGRVERHGETLVLFAAPSSYRRLE